MISRELSGRIKGKEVGIKPLRIIFMGTSSFGVSCLDYLSSRDDIQVAAVVTKPQRPKGRGRIFKDTPIKELAMENGLKVVEQKDVKKEGFARSLRELNPDLTVVAAFGKILPGNILNIPRYGSLNIHASLLPRYRGPSPINRAIINGEKETGITSFFMEEGIDTGPIISQRKISIESDDDRGVLEHRLKALAVDTLAETIDKIKDGKVTTEPQDETYATFAPKITSETGKIDWSLNRERICNLIRGLSPRPGAYSFFKKGGFINEPEDSAILIKIWKASCLKEGSSGEAGRRSHPFRGRVMEGTSSGLKVFSGKGIVAIEELQPAGKKRMTGQAFWSGYG